MLEYFDENNQMDRKERERLEDQRRAQEEYERDFAAGDFRGGAL